MSQAPRYQRYIESQVVRFPDSDIRFHPFETGATSSSPHYHAAAELSVMVAGEAVESVNGREHRVSAGSVTLRLPHHIHAYSAVPPGGRKCGLMFEMNMLLGSAADADWCGRLFQVGSHYESSTRLQGDDLAQMMTAYDLLRGEYEKGGHVGHDGMAKSLLSQMLILFLRNARPIDGRVLPASAEGNTILPSLLQYVHVNYTKPIGLASVARRFGVSTSYVSRLLRENTGKGIVAYVHELRVISATAMLSSTDMSAAEIAQSVGFESLRTFNRVFRDVLGVTPTEYRRRSEQQSEAAVDVHTV
jgi:AraC-like DNA-binding protein